MFDVVRPVFRAIRRGSVPRRNERAATIVEYMLIAAFVALPGVAGVDAMRNSASDRFNEEVADLTPDRAVLTSTTTTSPPTTTPGSTTTSTSTTTTSAPPSSTTTTTPPTTTTQPPPTTTSPPPPPTTVPPSSQATTSWGSTFTDISRNKKEWTAGASMTVVDGAGAPVGGASVTIRIEHRLANGQWSSYSADVSATTASNGVINVQSIWYDTPRGGNNPVAEQIRFVVVSVTKPGVTTQVGPPVVVNVPA